MKKIIFSFLMFTVAVNVFALEIKSPVLAQKGYIPSNYTCDGANISPEISWSDVPDNTQSLVLICDDPDASFNTWIHWVVYNIPAEVKKLEEGLPKTAKLDNGAMQGINDFGEVGFGGPCPPAGKAHRYFFRLYALDAMLKLETAATRKDVEKAMVGHILGETNIHGLYQKK